MAYEDKTGKGDLRQCNADRGAVIEVKALVLMVLEEVKTSVRKVQDEVLNPAEGVEVSGVVILRSRTNKANI